MPSDDGAEITNKIWLTSKARIYSEKRYRSYDHLSHLLLCLLSIIVIAITIVRSRLDLHNWIDEYTLIFAVTILAFSLVVYGFRFGEKATLHRECYLRLQRLHDCKHDIEDVARQYHEIIAAYPNHQPIDYEHLVLDRTLFNRRSLVGPDNKEIVWTFSMLAKWLVHLLIFWLIALLVPILSIYLFLLLWAP